MSLPTDRDERNALPIWDAAIMYFPDIWAELCKVSVLGNRQHALGDKLRWERNVSTDHLNKVFRHCLDHASGQLEDSDGTLHIVKALWRVCAEAQLTIERVRAMNYDKKLADMRKTLAERLEPTCIPGVYHVHDPVDSPQPIENPTL